jgi:hypothetical protein
MSCKVIKSGTIASWKPSLQPSKELPNTFVTPMLLGGFALLLFFVFLEALISSGIIPTVTAGDGTTIVLDIVQKGFLLSLFTIVLGFSLQFFKVHRRTLPPV